MSGWTVVDTATNKSLPVGGTQNSGAGVPYIAPSPASQDPVGKLRISSPQSLIDTDFEYGTQPTKWESISVQNNRSSVYYIPQQPLNVTALTGTVTTNQITLTLAAAVTIPNNTPIYVQNSTNSTINQWGYIITGGTSTTFTITFAPGTTITANLVQYFSATSTYVYIGYFYSNSGFQVNANCITVDSSIQLTIVTAGAHGLSRGSLIYINGNAVSGGTNVTGAFVVQTVPQFNSFTVTASGASGVPLTPSGNNVIYARPAGYVEPRSFDGGVAFSSGATVPNAQLIRQTRRYFRYQSGKGLQFSTGSCLKPALFVDRIQGSGGLFVQVTTRFNHNLTPGTQIQVQGADQGVFNGTFTVSSVSNPTVFQYTALTNTPGITATGSGIRVSPLTWFGANSRVGMFDQQNGMFFEYDGTNLNVVLRNSTNQISGSVTATPGSGTIFGTNTAFTTQLQPGQFIVIRGQTYRIVQIAGDTVMTVSPEYRGATTIANCIVSQTIDVRIPQSQWNIDRCDGTGPSGYNIDLTRMQMWYIDYSWYGAGFIRYGVRGTNGLITYVHQIQNNNRQFEAYMRSGNMAAHYEVSSIAPSTFLAAALSGNTTTLLTNILITQTTIPINETSFFNQSGGVALIGTEYIFYRTTSTPFGVGNLIDCVRGFGNTRADDYNAGNTISPSSISLVDVRGFPLPTAFTTPTVKITATNGLTEYISYTGITSSGILWGLTRGQTGGVGFANNFNPGVTSAVELVTPAAVPSLSHWGSSAIMDGLFNDDKSLIFNYGTTTAVSTSSTTPVVLMAIRVAPSVDNGITGLLGNKEIINRMQLQLESLGIVTTGNTYLINLILNGFCSGAMSGQFVAPIQQANGITSSLAQIAINTNAVNVTGGESVAAAYCNANGVTTLDLSQVRDLGNSILGGGTSNIVPTSQAGFYPDGPDILYVVAQAVSATAGTILARLSWKEAQA